MYKHCFTTFPLFLQLVFHEILKLPQESVKRQSAVKSAFKWCIYLNENNHSSNVLWAGMVYLVSVNIRLLTHFCCCFSWRSVKDEATRRVKSYWESHPDFPEKYHKWHRECDAFRTVLSLFTTAVKQYKTGRSVPIWMESACCTLDSLYY